MPYINNDLPAFTDNTPVNRSDLRRLVMGIMGCSGDLANKYIQSGTFPAGNRFTISVFPAKITSAYEDSPGESDTPTITARYNMTRLVTKEGQDSTELWTTRTETVPGIAQTFVATNLAELDPTGKAIGNILQPGEQVLIYGIWNRAEVTVNGSVVTTKSANTQFYVFCFTPVFPAVATITSNVSGCAGKYNGTIYAIPTTDDGTGDLELPDGMTVGVSCLIINTEEDDFLGTATGTHRLKIGSYPVGTYGGMSDETPPRPTIIIRGGFGRVDSPQTLPHGTYGSPDATTWARQGDATPIQFDALWWGFDASSGMIFLMTRTPLYDARGVLYSVSAEVQTTIATTACAGTGGTDSFSGSMLLMGG